MGHPIFPLMRDESRQSALASERVTSGMLSPYGGRGTVKEIIFEVLEDEADGGYTASALGYGIHTQGDTLDELRTMVRDAVDCYFDKEDPSRKIIRLHFVRDEVLV